MSRKRKKHKLVEERFLVEGITCPSCEEVIREQALAVDGVNECKVDYSTQQGTLSFDTARTNIDEILDSIEEKGYKCYIFEGEGAQPKESPELVPSFNLNQIKQASLLLGLLVILFGGYQIVQNFGIFSMPALGAGTSLAFLFFIGLLTGFHCIGMCGGFVMSYTAKAVTEGKKVSHVPHLKYGAGKLMSYTVIGGLFGLLGSFVTFTPLLRGTAAVLAGLFLILFGLNTLNAFPVLRTIRLPTPKFLTRRARGYKGKSPFIVGLLNGLMLACGPLQAIYIYAAGTGNVVQGAASLFAFGLGTLPVLLGFGLFASYVSKSLTHQILRFSGVVVIVLGVIMLNSGLALAGTGYDVNSLVISASPTGATVAGGPQLNEGYQEIRMDVVRYGWAPDKFLLKKGVPVRWIITGKQINGCNNAIQVPKLGLDFDIRPGEQVIEFTPKEEGIIPWSCWMGMISGTFIVRDNVELSEAEIQKELAAVKVPSGSCSGACGGSCGSTSCGCGGRR